MPAYARPSNLTEALGLAARGHLVLAGGTDIYPHAGPGLRGDVVDISGVPELRGVSLNGGLRIGACTTWAELAHARLPPALHALQQAAAQIGGRQVQNAGTIGGNICNASPAADGIPPLLVLEPEVELAGPEGSRRLPLDQCLIGPRKLDRRPGEVLVALHIPARALHGRSVFAKLGARRHLVISIAMVALRLTLAEGRITGAFAAVGACGPKACRLTAVEQALLGQDPGALVLDPALIHRALSPIDDIRASSTYRTEAATILLGRLVKELAQ